MNGDHSNFSKFTGGFARRTTLQSCWVDGPGRVANEERGQAVAPSLTDVLALLQRGRERIDATLKQTNVPRERTAHLTEAMAAIWPTSPLHACLLWEEQQ